LKPTKIVIDLSKPQGEQESVVELTDDEIAQQEALILEAAQLEKEQADREAEKQALIESLGLTDDQVALLGL
jgi:hypothetical protein